MIAERKTGNTLSCQKNEKKPAHLLPEKRINVKT
jgi:hypothetical protein